jgi:hypothetical protein
MTGRAINMWLIRPMREMLKRRNLEERDCATAVGRFRSQIVFSHTIIFGVVNSGVCSEIQSVNCSSY